MINEIYKDIMAHLDLIDAVDRESKLILRAARLGDLDQVDVTIENRDRLIKILESTQGKIEQKTHLLENHELNEESIGILKSWLNDLNLWVEKNLSIDAEIVALLEQEKDETTKQISTVFKSRQQHKGYNLNNVKK